MPALKQIRHRHLSALVDLLRPTLTALHHPPDESTLLCHILNAMNYTEFPQAKLTAISSILLSWLSQHRSAHPTWRSYGLRKATRLPITIPSIPPSLAPSAATMSPTLPRSQSVPTSSSPGGTSPSVRRSSSAPPRTPTGRQTAPVIQTPSPTQRTVTAAAAYVGLRIAKPFGGTLYIGRITQYKPPDEDVSIPLWQVDYEDSDCEDMNEDEVQAFLQPLPPLSP